MKLSPSASTSCPVDRPMGDLQLSLSMLEAVKGKASPKGGSRQGKGGMGVCVLQLMHWEAEGPQPRHQRMDSDRSLLPILNHAGRMAVGHPAFLLQTEWQDCVYVCWG